MKKLLLSFFMLLIGFCSSDLLIHATEDNEDTSSQNIKFETNIYSSDKETVYYDKETGTAYIFESAEDLDSYLAAQKNSLLRTSGTYTKSTVISTSSVSKAWIGYHSGTPNWAKASGYTLSASKTYTANGTYTYSGTAVGVSVSYSTTVATKFPANSSKYSKLGIKGDLSLRTYRIDEYDKYSGRFIRSWNIKTATVTNYYVSVYYQ